MTHLGKNGSDNETLPRAARIAAGETGSENSLRSLGHAQLVQHHIEYRATQTLVTLLGLHQLTCWFALIPDTFCTSGKT